MRALLVSEEGVRCHCEDDEQRMAGSVAVAMVAMVKLATHKLKRALAQIFETNKVLALNANRW